MNFNDKLNSTDPAPDAASLMATICGSNSVNISQNWSFCPDNTEYDSYVEDYYAEHTWMRWVVYNMDIYLVPVVICLGLLGNTLSFIVFVTTNLRALSSSVYLAALAVSDNGFLVCVLVGWLVNVNFNFYEYQGLCQLFLYLTYVFGFLSVFYVVGFTVERYIAVCFPFKRSEMCTPERAKLVVIAMAFFAVVIFSHVLWISRVDVYNDTAICHIKPGFEHLAEVTNHLDTFMTLVLPSVAIFVVNCRIVYVVVTVHTRYREQFSLVTPNSSSTFRVVRETCARRSGSNIHVTKLLLIVSSVFLLLNFPNHVLRLHLYVMQFLRPDFEPSTNYQQCKILFQHIYYVNFSVNFLLYSVCGRNFRKALKNLLTCRKRKK